MAGFNDAALRVIHQDGEPLMTKPIDAGDREGFIESSPVLFSFFSMAFF